MSPWQITVAVQPADVHGFMSRYYRRTFGPPGAPIRWMTQKPCGRAGGPALVDLDPVHVAPGAGRVPVPFVRETGDRRGGVADAERMIAATPGAIEPIVPETEHRFDGCNWVVEHPRVVLDFFRSRAEDGGSGPVASAGG